MIEIFGRLRTKEALPFLVEHIAMDENAMATIWMKSPQSIAASVPGVQALLRIGPDATPALLRALEKLPYYKAGVPGDYKKRIAIVVTLAMMRDRRAKPALEKEIQHSDAGEAAFQGLRWLEGKN